MKEYLDKNIKEQSVAVQNSKVVSVRFKQEDKHTVRVYKDGYVGVAGAVGGCDLKELEKKAEERLAFGIEYPEIPSAPARKRVERKVENFDETHFVGKVESLLERLTAVCPKFIFSNKAYISEKESAYRNDCGTELSFRNEVITVALSIKDKGSANIMDTFFGYETRHYDEDKIVQYAKKLHNDYFRTVEVEDGVYPVIIGNDFLTQAVNHFEGRLYTLGASLLSGKLGEKVFNERVSIISDYMSPRGSQCFFDDEGIFFEDGKYYYVKNGVLTGLLATKKYKNDFGLEISGCAAAAYDSIPNASVRENGFFVQPTNNNIKEITRGKAILLNTYSGGDFTPAGDYSTPVMVGFLIEDGEIKGRINGSFNVSGNLFKLLGDDFLGAIPEETPSEMSGINLVMNMKLMK